MNILLTQSHVLKTIFSYCTRCPLCHKSGDWMSVSLHLDFLFYTTGSFMCLFQYYTLTIATALAGNGSLPLSFFKTTLGILRYSLCSVSPYTFWKQLVNFHTHTRTHTSADILIRLIIIYKLIWGEVITLSLLIHECRRGFHLFSSSYEAANASREKAMCLPSFKDLNTLNPGFLVARQQL